MTHCLHQPLQVHGALQAAADARDRAEAEARAEAELSRAFDKADFAHMRVVRCWPCSDSQPSKDVLARLRSLGAHLLVQALF